MSKLSKKVVLSFCLGAALATGGCAALSSLLPVAGGSGIILQAGTTLLNWVIQASQDNGWTREQTAAGLREACAALDKADSERGFRAGPVTPSDEAVSRVRTFLATGK